LIDFLNLAKVTAPKETTQKAVSPSLLQKKLLKIAKSSKSSISELECKYQELFVWRLEVEIRSGNFDVM